MGPSHDVSPREKPGAPDCETRDMDGSSSVCEKSVRFLPELGPARDLLSVNFDGDVSFADHARVARSEVDFSMFVKHEDIAAQIEAAVDKSLAALAAANSAANASLVSVIADNVTKAISTFDATVNTRLADVRDLLNERRSAVTADTGPQKDISRRVDFTYRHWEMFSADAPLLAAPGRDLAGFSADLATFVADVEEDVVAGAPSSGLC